MFNVNYLFNVQSLYAAYCKKDENHIYINFLMFITMAFFFINKTWNRTYIFVLQFIKCLTFYITLFLLHRAFKIHIVACNNI